MRPEAVDPIYNIPQPPNINGAEYFRRSVVGTTFSVLIAASCTSPNAPTPEIIHPPLLPPHTPEATLLPCPPPVSVEIGGDKFDNPTWNNVTNGTYDAPTESSRYRLVDEPVSGGVIFTLVPQAESVTWTPDSIDLKPLPIHIDGQVYIAPLTGTYKITGLKEIDGFLFVAVCNGINLDGSDKIVYAALLNFNPNRLATPYDHFESEPSS